MLNTWPMLQMVLLSCCGARQSKVNILPSVLDRIMSKKYVGPKADVTDLKGRS